ncbi:MULTISPECIES: BREX-6 system BrxE protein [Rhodopirellula]|uniref:BREX-6 system BrxE protein n=1 Tax=Rhodopirellula TaxID=265488 RepID=UPI00257FAF3A|nr:BREX-6 system BrxE protein [Rhodopirellula sp. UBA1907]
MSEANAATASVLSATPLRGEIDALLAAQLIVAWAGESGSNDDPATRRLGWWRTDLVGDAAEYELQELLPNTWRWAKFQAVREAARLHDSSVREKDHDPDRLLTLFSLGFAIDEKVEDRLRQLKLAGADPCDEIPQLGEIVSKPWSLELIAEWATSFGKESFTKVPSGRRLKGKPPEKLGEITNRLIAGLAPIADSYPMPHFRRDQ